MILMIHNTQLLYWEKTWEVVSLSHVMTKSLTLEHCSIELSAFNYVSEFAISQLIAHFTKHLFHCIIISFIRVQLLLYNIF